MLISMDAKKAIQDPFLTSDEFCKSRNKLFLCSLRIFKNIYDMLITNFVITVSMPIIKWKLIDRNLEIDDYKERKYKNHP